MARICTSSSPSMTSAICERMPRMSSFTRESATHEMPSLSLITPPSFESATASSSVSSFFTMCFLRKDLSVLESFDSTIAVVAASASVVSVNL